MHDERQEYDEAKIDPEHRRALARGALARIRPDREGDRRDHAEEEGAELVSLEDADDEAKGDDLPDLGDDDDVDLGDDDDDTFLEDEEEDGDDVSDMIGVGDDDDEA